MILSQDLCTVMLSCCRVRSWFCCILDIKTRQFQASQDHNNDCPLYYPYKGEIIHTVFSGCRLPLKATLVATKQRFYAKRIHLNWK